MTKSLADVRRSQENTPEVTEAYAAARLRYELGKVVRERREELGWTQTELGRRSGMSQPAIARFEAGGTVPTLPLLVRIAEALGLRLTVNMTPGPEASAGRGSIEGRLWILVGSAGQSVPGEGGGDATESTGMSTSVERPRRGTSH